MSEKRSRRRHGGFHGGPPMGMPTEKAKNFKGTLKRLVAYLSAYKVKFAAVFLLAIMSTVFAVVGPKINGKAVTKLTEGFINKLELRGLREAKSNLNGIIEIQGKMVQIGKKETPIIISAQKKMMSATGAKQPLNSASGASSAQIQKQQMPGGKAYAQPSAEDMKKLMKFMSPEDQKKIEAYNKQLADLGNKLKGKATALKKMQAKQQAALGKKGKVKSATQKSMTPQQMKAAVAKIDKQIKGIMKENHGKIDFGYIGNILLMLIGLYVISALFSYVMSYLMSGVAQKAVYNMRNDVNDKLNRLPLKYFDSRTHGEILSRVTNDLDNVANTLQQSLTQLITSVVTIIGILCMMISISGILTLIALAVLPVSTIITIAMAKKSQKYFGDQQKELGNLSGHVEEMYSGHKIVKAFGHEKKAINEFSEINDRLYDAGWKAQFVSGVIFPLLNFVNNLGYVGVCVVGGYYVTKSKLKMGDITSFIQYMRQFTQPIVQTANIANIIQSTVASAERVFELLDEEEEIPDSTASKVIKSPNGEVRFEHVKFGYKEDAILMEDMNIDVKQGQTIAIVGPTGAGKTTLVNLLMRFYEVNSGKVTVDGVNINEMKRGDLRTMFGMVLQDTWLFNGTIRDNIAYGRDGATEEEIVRAAKAAHADHFIRTLPEGYNTILNEEASNISQGQRQLLTIARAILADPAILILDEATSSVDTRTEVYIQRAMTNLMKGRTSFVIAHRLSTIRDADLILVMNHGAIIEQGNHHELLEKGGFYADLYNSQFTGANLEGYAS